MVRLPTSRTPTHPGEMLLDEFLIPMGLTQRALADAIHVPYQRINALVNGRSRITPSLALRLARVFGISADFWVNLQARFDLYVSGREEKEILDKIYPFGVSPDGH